MPAILKSPLFLISATVVVCIVVYMSFFIQDPIDYNAEVKPIINKKCISCHGGVKKKAGFSLLFQEEALAATASGKPAIIPGDAKNSEMIKRLNYTDLEERMPYHKAPLTDDEKEILTKWVDQGAKFSTHWAYEPIKKPNVPSTGFFSFLSWGKTDEIDAFVDEKLDEIGLSRSGEADKKTLLRRVSLDLIGMPAPKTIADKYLSETSDKAYQNLVNDLLALPSYGEKWAGMWMDISRYADTKGYERDDARSIWRYRDWLINAFNNDKPYDQFITEQLAGDLLPDATDEQFIATAFHRNTMTNDEGGTETDPSPPENLLRPELDQATNQNTAANEGECVPGVFPILVLMPNGCIRASDRVYASCSNAGSSIGLGNLNIAAANCQPGEDLCSGGLPLEGA